jgi:pimeloyl-ACP methyl ester carboxylesterase
VMEGSSTMTTSPSLRPPVLMLHGMCCTGEVWRHFRGLFEARGARVYSPTLRPELRVRRSPSRDLRALTFADYVEDVVGIAAELEREHGEQPVVIGHSMGGALAQALAERNKVQAAVLISPSPPAGVRTPAARVWWAAVSVGRLVGALPGSIKPARRTADNIVFNRVPRTERDAAFAGMVHESGRAFADLGRYAVDEKNIRVPLLTVAASDDRLVPASLVRLTARKYAAVGGELREYEGHGHWLYAEPGWEKPAAEIFDWLVERTARALS